MLVKPGVDIRNIQPETIFGMLVVEDVLRSLNQVLTITSVCDGHHKPGSLHYEGYAFDLRIWDFRGISTGEITKRLSEALGVQYQVIQEPSHIHVEFDP